MTTALIQPLEVSEALIIFLGSLYAGFWAYRFHSERHPDAWLMVWLLAVVSGTGLVVAIAGLV